jgi:hypothetical protein
MVAARAPGFLGRTSEREVLDRLLATALSEVFAKLEIQSRHDLAGAPPSCESELAPA